MACRSAKQQAFDRQTELDCRVREHRRAAALAAGSTRPLPAAVQPDHQRTARLQGLVVAPPVGGLVLGGIGPDSVAHLGSLQGLIDDRLGDMCSKVNVVSSLSPT